MKAVVVSGPESSGKTTLTFELAEYFSVTGVPEYARCYIERLNRPYTIADVETIAKRQIAIFKLLKRRKNSDELVFFDTFLIITKVWFQEVYKLCPIWLHLAIKEFTPVFVLLCNPDIPWIYDKIRENPDKREHLLNCYHQEFEYYNIDFQHINGVGHERLVNSVHALFINGIKIEKNEPT